jgi:hypothetical protein
VALGVLPEGEGGSEALLVGAGPDVWRWSLAR